MTPAQHRPALHRSVLTAFAVVTVGVAANLVLLQPATSISKTVRALPTVPLTLSQAFLAPETVNPSTGAPPASRNAGQPMELGPRRFARLNAGQINRASDTLPEAPDAEGDTSTISAVQRELSARGYGQLTPDGVPGLVTRAAIMAYEFDHQMPLKGEATAALLARIVLGLSGSTGATPDPAAGRVRSPQAELVMRTVQQSLAALGYQVGKIDGRTGDDIARAIREFELDEGLKQTGRVSADVFSRLGRVVASAKPKPAQ